MVQLWQKSVVGDVNNTVSPFPGLSSAIIIDILGWYFLMLPTSLCKQPCLLFKVYIKRLGDVIRCWWQVIIFMSPKFEIRHPHHNLCQTLLNVLIIIVTFWFKIPSCWDSSRACKSSSWFLFIKISKLIGGYPLIQTVTRSKYSFASYITFVYLSKNFQLYG